MKALIIDDNQDFTKWLIDELKKIGVVALNAKTAKEGENRVEEEIKKGEEPIKLVFMDLKFPPESGRFPNEEMGIELTKKLLSKFPSLSIIGMSGDIDEERKKKWEEAGIKGIFLKDEENFFEKLSALANC
jgi:CheY-like chemotaxis protein